MLRGGTSGEGEQGVGMGREGLVYVWERESGRGRDGIDLGEGEGKGRDGIDLEAGRGEGEGLV